MDEADRTDNVVEMRPSPPRLEDADPESLVTVGGPIDRVEVHLRFFGDELDPAEVSRLLGSEPTDGLRKGDPLPGRYARVAERGRWLLDGDFSLNDVEDQLDALLDGLTDDLAVWEDLTRRLDADVFCGVFLEDWNRGFALSPELMRKLSDRGLTIDFDIYTHAAPDHLGDGGSTG